MTHIQSFFFSQALIWIPLLLGHQFRRRGLAGRRLADVLQRINMFGMNMLIYGLGVWRLEHSQGDWMRVLAAQMLIVTLSTILAAWLVPRFFNQRPTIGTLSLMLPISNTGFTLAGFLTIILISESAYAYNAIITIPFAIMIMFAFVPLAQYWGSPPGQRSFIAHYRRVFFSAQMAPLLGVVCGFALNAAHVPMTPAWSSFMRWSVMAGTFMTMFAMGITLHLRRTAGHQRRLWPVYIFKFVITPLTAIGLCLLLGLRGEGAASLMIASFMPVGVTVVGMSTIYKLDLDLANAGYLWTTLIFMLIVLPFVILALRLPLFH